jgi:glycosyltransferase involved in cell wall biosynthesis
MGEKKLEREPYKISIIIPIYNGGENIAAAFASVTRQTIGFERLEVIFADDASTDGSGAIIDGLAARHPNVKALHCGENSGYAGRPRNAGMQAATAPYLMFLDQDDRYYPGACEQLWTAGEADGCDVVAGYYSIHDRAGRVIAAKSGLYTAYGAFRIESADEMPEVMKFRVGLWTKLYRTQTIRTNGIRFVEDTPAEDLVFFTELAMVMRGFRYIDAPIVQYALRNAADPSLTYRMDVPNARAVAGAFAAAYEVLRRHGRTDLYPHLAEGTTKFYMDMLLDNDLSSTRATADYVEALDFIFRKAHEYRVFDGSGSAEVLTALACREEYELAALFLREIQSLCKQSRRYEDLHNKLKYSRILKVIGKLRGWELD